MAHEGSCSSGRLELLRAIEGEHLGFLKGNISRRESGTVDKDFQRGKVLAAIGRCKTL